VPVEPPDFASGHATFRTETPVVAKTVLPRSAEGERKGGTPWRLPGEPEWDVCVQNNLRRKAETLGLDPEVTLESVGWVGPKRSFAVAGAAGGGGKKPGACVEVTVSGSPETLSALADWGLGQANAAGMGWISA
jgi:CRISPR-associated endoribonuclease Cas6